MSRLPRGAPLALICGAIIPVVIPCLTCRAAEMAYNNGAGGIEALVFEGAPQAVQTILRVPLKGWTSTASQEAWSVRDVAFSSEGRVKRWTGTMAAGQEAFRYEQVQTESDGVVTLDLKVVSESDARHEGAFLFIDFPVAAYGGGTCRALAGSRETKSAALPKDKPVNRHLLNTRCDEVLIASQDGGPLTRVELPGGLPVAVQDNREWGSQTYSVYVCFHDGTLPRMSSASARVTLRMEGHLDAKPVRLKIDAQQKRYRFEGFGGNYCFGIESPVTEYTLKNLRVGCARVEMTLSEWEDANDNDSPADADWTFFRSRVKPGSNLEREFVFAKRIQEKGIPYGISAWRMPKWLLPQTGTSVARALWPEMIESVCTYLAYAKREYAVEPDWFSFNEPDYGVDVKFLPHEHRDAIKLFGARFEELGLRTKLLLGDVTNARGTHTYVAPATADSDAMRYVSAIAFHSWGGATPDEYAAWGDLAERLGLPLYVTEAGVDAAAWRTPWYVNSFRYAMREVMHLQEPVLHARPCGTMFWEFTSDYGLADVTREGVVTSKRFWFMKHLCDLTPEDADALVTTSDADDVLMTAFFNGKSRFAMHIANAGAERKAFVFGIPWAARHLDHWRTSGSEDYARLERISVRGSTIALTLPPQSLTTLTSPVGPTVSASERQLKVTTQVGMGAFPFR